MWTLQKRYLHNLRRRALEQLQDAHIKVLQDYVLKLHKTGTALSNMCQVISAFCMLEETASQTGTS